MGRTPDAETERLAPVDPAPPPSKSSRALRAKSCPSRDRSP